MSRAPIITLAQLKELGACPSERRKFRRLFGRSLTVTIRAAREHGHKLNVVWAASHMLKPRYAREYDRAAGNVYAVYMNRRLALHRKYTRPGETYALPQEVLRVCNPKYRAALDKINTQRLRDRAVAFARVYIAQARGAK